MLIHSRLFLKYYVYFTSQLTLNAYTRGSTVSGASQMLQLHLSFPVGNMIADNDKPRLKER